MGACSGKNWANKDTARIHPLPAPHIVTEGEKECCGGWGGVQPNYSYGWRRWRRTGSRRRGLARRWMREDGEGGQDRMKMESGKIALGRNMWTHRWTPLPCCFFLTQGYLWRRVWPILEYPLEGFATGAILSNPTAKTFRETFMFISNRSLKSPSAVIRLDCLSAYF